MEKPLITIDKWSGMSEDGGIYYSDGFLAENVGGNSCISEEFRPTSFSHRYTSSAFSNFYSGVSDLCSYDDGSGYGYNNLIWTDRNQRLFKYELGGYSGQIHMIPAINDAGHFITADYNSFLRMESNNFLYCGANYLGIGYHGYVETGSGTTSIIDTAGRNWTTLGVVVGESQHNKVTNLETGAEYTITSITTTNETNDTLNFTASGALTNSHNDQFIVWIDDAVYLNTTYNSQVRRKCEKYGDQYIFTFNDYIGVLGSDEITADETYKQLPINSEALYLSTNGSKILVASDLDGKGQLLLWDGYSDGWNNILDIDNVAYTLHPYKNGWVYMINNTLYFTDGWTTQVISTYPDKNYVNNTYGITPNYNGIAITNEMIYVVCGNYNYNRTCFTCVAFNFNSGWYGVPALAYGSSTRLSYGNGGAVFYKKNLSRYYVFLGTAANLIGYSENPEYTNAYLNRSFIHLVNLKKPTQIKEIALNITHNLKEILDENHLGDTATITVNVGDAHKGIFSRAQIKAGSTASSILPSGNTFKYAEVGNEVQIMSYGEVSLEETAGERTYITAITDAGTTSEAWAISPSLSTTPDTSTEIRIINVKKSDTKTVSIEDLNEPVRFNVDGFYSNKIFIEVVINGATTAFPVSILDLQIYGN